MFEGAKALRTLFVLALLVGFTGAVEAQAEKLKAVPAGGSSSNDDAGFVTEKRKDGTTIKYKKKATYDFEGTNVEGLYNKPSGSYISNIKDVKAKTIMRIRKNFDAEVIDSARMVK